MRPDWDRAVYLRESSFRTDLYRLFSEENFIRSDGGIKIRTDGQLLTDIDAVIFDKSSKSLGLFQLKWQDPFSHSMRARESQKKNLLRTGNEWVNRTASWVSKLSPSALLERLGFGAISRHGLSDVKIFVIGRHAAHFSGEGEYHPDAAWGMWPQVVKLMHRNWTAKDKLSTLHAELKIDSPLRKPFPKLGTYEFRIGDVRITYELD